ncbi:ABC transporter ATP-binding protein [Corynebacterium sphenisci]|uniref:ABC transporter ATP-binding protein n=1 Tax=Corynebacterium sphenisci TaxID=191493 RepID=UPI0026DEFB98|nr:ABC transporter ATP-binding protein [Corynebacterium sphenisci]MDO5730551.1 ABC transporter ATP-binding protein [Corynebacterium sphenisci]
MHDDAPETAGAGPAALLPTASAGQAVAEIAGLLRPRWVHALTALAVTFAASAASLAPVLLLREVINIVAAGDSAAGLPRILALALAAAVLAGVAATLARGLTGTLIARLLADLRERAVAAVLAIPPGRVERAGRGDLIGRIGADVAVLVGGFLDEVPGLLSAMVLVLTATAGIAGLDWRLAAAGALAGLAYAHALRWYLRHSAHLYRRERRQEARLLGDLMAAVDGRATVRAHHLLDERRARVAADSARSRDTSVRVFRAYSGLIARDNLAEFTGLAAITVAGWLLLRGGEVRIGDVAAALMLFHRMFDPIGDIITSADELQRSGAALTRIVGLVRLTGGAPPPAVDPAALPDAPVDVAVTGLTHVYPDGRVGLAGVDLAVPAGEVIALVGGSGAGKSTLAGILSGMLPHHGSGTVRIGGRDLADLDAPARTGLVAVASQETHLFAGTLRENLLLADPAAGDDRLAAALAAVGAGDWLAGLERGLDTRVGSGGVAAPADVVQRVALARIRLAPAPVVVLDEPSAEESDLMAAAAAAIRGRTAVVVAHRLGQAAAADRVAVLAAGRVVESGDHAGLLAAGGAYAELWAAWGGGARGPAGAGADTAAADAGEVPGR